MLVSMALAVISYLLGTLKAAARHKSLVCEVFYARGLIIKVLI